MLKKGEPASGPKPGGEGEVPYKAEGIKSPTVRGARAREAKRAARGKEVPEAGKPYPTEGEGPERAGEEEIQMARSLGVRQGKAGGIWIRDKNQEGVEGGVNYTYVRTAEELKQYGLFLGSNAPEGELRAYVFKGNPHAEYGVELGTDESIILATSLDEAFDLYKGLGNLPLVSSVAEMTLEPGLLKRLYSDL